MTTISVDFNADAAQSLIVTHTVTLAKQAGRQLDERKSAQHIEAIAKAALTTERIKRGWAIDGSDNPAFKVEGDGTRGYTYSVALTVKVTPTRVRSTIAQEFDNIVASMDQKAQLPAFRWRVADIDGEVYVPKSVEAVVANPDENVGYAPFELGTPEQWREAFKPLYGLDDYIEIIRSALELAEMSGWTQRVNIALIGPPACGKSHLCKILKKLLGDEAVMEYDGTSTTAAGAQKDLSEREEMPRVLIVEEIEKAPEASLAWLLSVLDLRGEIRKTTARGKIDQNIKMVGICTVNDESLFNKIASGALSSRYAMPLHFQRPTRDVLWQILNREVQAIGGDEAWIEPAIDFAERLNAANPDTPLIDPRKLIAICLTGREKLIPTKAHPQGEFQERFIRTMRTDEARTINRTMPQNGATA